MDPSPSPRDAIKTFARAYDPQPFHLDEEAGKRSLFGGLAASGWHTASVYMKLLVAYLKDLTEAAEARGEPVAQSGPSPGFKNLKWPRPVLAGDTVTYYLRGDRDAAARLQARVGPRARHDDGR